MRDALPAMIELTLPDGRACRLEVLRDPATDPPAVSVRVSVVDEAPRTIALTAGWEQADALPQGVVEAIIRHVLLQ